MNKKIAITSFESSGDLHSSLLVKKLKQMDNNIVFLGAGGHSLKSEELEHFTDTSSWGVIGIWEAVKKVPYLWFKVDKLKKDIVKFKPDLLILIDSPAINVRIAEYVKKHNIKMMYYFPPSAWRKENLDKTRRYARFFDYVVPVFEHTKNMYEKAGKKVYYFGHPIVDAIEDARRDKHSIKKEYRIKEDKVIGLLPGSRAHEVRLLLGSMIETSMLIHEKDPETFFMIPASSPHIEKIIRDYLTRAKTGFPVRVTRSAYDVMQASDLIITSSGTATLEAAYFLTPMIVLYRLNWFDYTAAKILFPYLKHISLPNIILGKEVVPEFIQKDISPRRISVLARELIKESPARRDMLCDLRRIKENFESGGVINKVAGLIRDIINKVEE
ncbi:MAG: lipid-A-disaccharide synthase [Armatimonadota bacterium]